MPSCRFIGPENRSSTVREERARSQQSGAGCSGSSEAPLQSGGVTGGMPGAWPSSGYGECATASVSTCCPAGRQG
eukprot:686949-Pleurochrysis_carterae.AAC.1